MTRFSPIEQIAHPIFKHHNIDVVIKRDDLIHPIISGNKWRKLKFNLEHARNMSKEGVISFGGAYSNHIHALALACSKNNLSSIGVIRGEPHYGNNFTLSAAQRWGMQLHFVDRETYRKRNDSNYLSILQKEYPNHFIVPEGGSNALALKGVGETINELNSQHDYNTLIVPTGSGGTLAGLVKADINKHEILGVAVLKQAEYLVEEINSLLGNESSQYTRWRLLTDYHRGGYAKFSNRDLERILKFSNETSIPFEPVYSGKMLLAFLDLLEQGYFPSGHKVVLLHTGGLQGIGGMVEQGRLDAANWYVPEF